MYNENIIDSTIKQLEKNSYVAGELYRLLNLEEAAYVNQIDIIKILKDMVENNVYIFR